MKVGVWHGIYSWLFKDKQTEGMLPQRPNTLDRKMMCGWSKQNNVCSETVNENTNYKLWREETELCRPNTFEQLVYKLMIDTYSRFIQLEHNKNVKPDLLFRALTFNSEVHFYYTNHYALYRVEMNVSRANKTKANCFHFCQTAGQSLAKTSLIASSLYNFRVLSSLPSCSTDSISIQDYPNCRSSR